MPTHPGSPGDDARELLDRAKDAFLELIEIEPAGRAARIEVLCGDDPALRQVVADLLEAHDGAPEFLVDEAGGGVAGRPLEPGTRVGPYRVERVLGEGGFGVVYLASQEEPFRRAVALKLLKPGMDSARIVARFDAERQTLAAMDHPGIAKVLDAGETARGEPFIAMEFVDGAPITAFCDAARLDTTGRLVLFERVCLAVQHAHQKGVIHRDLKPSNVMVTDVDGEAVPKVIDFGIAKATGGRRAGHTLTGERLVVGTPEYMAPEQTLPIADGGADVDTRADVFSLGVILYRLLTGRSPYAVTSFDVPGPDAWARTIRERDVPRPSSSVRDAGEAAAEIAMCRGTTPERLVRTLRSELDWIVLRAIEKDRARRYQSASELAADVRRHLRHEPVESGPPSASYRLAKFCRRHRAAVSAAVTVFVFAIVTALVSARAAFVAERERREAARQQALAERQSYVANVFAAEAALASGDCVGARRRLEATPAALRGWEWRHLAARLDVSTHVLSRPGASPESVEPCPDGRWLAVGWNDGTVEVVDARAGEVVARRGATAPSSVRLAWGRDGRALFVAHAEGAERWDWRANRSEPLTGHGDEITAVATTAGGAVVVTGALDGTVRSWDPDTLGEVRAFEHGSRVRIVAVSPDGATVASVGQDQTFALWDRASGARRGGGRAARPTTPIVPDQAWPPAEITAIGFSPSSTRFVTGCRDGRVAVWDVQRVEPIAELDAHRDVVRSVAWSADGARVAVACRDGTATLWDAERFGLVATLEHDGDVRQVEFDARGAILVTCSWDRTVRLFDAVRGEPLEAMLGHEDVVYGARLADAGAVIASFGADGTVRLWRTPVAKIALGSAHPSAIYAIATGPGAMLVSGGLRDRAFVWDLADGHDATAPVPLGDGDGIHSVAVSPDGARVATGGADGRVRIWDPVGGTVLHTLGGHDDRVECLAFDASGRVLVSGSRDRTARLWDVASGQPIRTLAGHGGEVLAVAVLGGSGAVVSTCEDGIVRCWDPRTGRCVQERDLASGMALGLAPSPDGSTIAVGTAARTILLLDAATLEVRASLDGHAELVTSLAWLPDGSRLVSGSTDRTVKLWDPTTGEALATLRGHTRQVQAVAVSADGSRIFSAGEDRTVRIWEAGGRRAGTR